MIKDIRDWNCFMIPAYKTYTRQERAREILFKGASIEEFTLAFVLGSEEYYKRG